jgi:hypothetical protein
LSQFAEFQKSFSELELLQYPAGLKASRDLAEDSLSNLNETATSASIVELLEIELIRPVDAATRHAVRCKVLDVLKMERQAAGLVMLTRRANSASKLESRCGEENCRIDGFSSE